MTTLAQKKEADRLARKATSKIFENLTHDQARLFSDEFKYMLADAVKGLELVCSAAEAELYDDDGERLVFDEDDADAVSLLEEVVRVGEKLLDPLYELQTLRTFVDAALLEAENETCRTRIAEALEQNTLVLLK